MQAVQVVHRGGRRAQLEIPTLLHDEFGVQQARRQLARLLDQVLWTTPKAMPCSMQECLVHSERSYVRHRRSLQLVDGCEETVG